MFVRVISWIDYYVPQEELSTKLHELTPTKRLANLGVFGRAIIRLAPLEPKEFSHPIGPDPLVSLRDPFPVVNLFNFSVDQRTRIMVFGSNLELLPNETFNAITARAEDAQMNIFPLTVEFAGQPQEWIR